MSKKTSKKSINSLPGRIVQVDPQRQGAAFYGEHVIQTGGIGLHWHNFTEVDFICGGTGTQILNGTESWFSRGTITVLSDSDFHMYEANGKIDIYSFHATDVILSEDISNLTHKLSGVQFFINDSAIVDQLEHEFQQLFYELDQTDNDYRVRFISNIFERIILIIGRYGKANSGGIAANVPHNKEIIYIDRHFREPFSLERIAEKFHYSTTYFSKLFKSKYSFTFQEYLLEKRLSWTYPLVRLTDMPITEICYNAGFNNHAYFCRQFKKKFGKSPSSIRAERTKKEQ